MLPEYFALVGAVVTSLGGVVYLYETIRGRVQPNRVTWLLWGLIPLVVFVAQRVQGVDGASWVSFVVGFVPLLVFAASFLNRKAYWQTRPLDYVCAVLAIFGVVLWAVTNNPNLAIMISIGADFAAGLPTIRKTWQQPQTESWRAYAVSAVGLVVSLMAVPVWAFEQYGFIIYILIINTGLAILSARRPQVVV